MAFLDPTDKNRPAYVHQEYPKHINFVDKTFKVANDAAEESLIVAENSHKLPKLTASSTGDVANESDAIRKAKASLVSVAERLGIEIDKRWSIEKIESAINDAFDTQAEPKKTAKDELGDD